MPNNDEWGEVPLPKTTKVTTNEDSSDANDDLYSEAALEQVAEKVTKERAKARAQQEQIDDDEEEADDTDESSGADEDTGEDEDEQEQGETEASDDTKTSESEKDGKETEPEAKKTESRIPKRIEQLINKLKERDILDQQREIEFAQREAQYLQAIQELEGQSSSNASLVASSQLKEAESAVEAARRKLRSAKMNADDDAELEALEELADAKARQREAAALAAKAPKNDEDAPQRAPVNPRQLLAYRKNQAWVEANKQSLQNPQVAMAVQAIDKQLQQEGFDPADDDYRSELSKRTNKTLSTKGIKAKINNPFEAANYGDDVVGDEPAATSAAKETSATVAKAPAKKPLNPMSKGSPMPAKKSKTAARLDDNDKYIAHKFGLKGENLLKQRALSNRTSGEGYVPVYIPTNTKK